MAEPSDPHAPLRRIPHHVRSAGDGSARGLLRFELLEGGIRNSLQQPEAEDGPGCASREKETCRKRLARTDEPDRRDAESDLRPIGQSFDALGVGGLYDRFRFLSEHRSVLDLEPQPRRRDGPSVRITTEQAHADDERGLAPAVSGMACLAPRLVECRAETGELRRRRRHEGSIEDLATPAVPVMGGAIQTRDRLGEGVAVRHLNRRSAPGGAIRSEDRASIQGRHRDQQPDEPDGAPEPLAREPVHRVSP